MARALAVPRNAAAIIERRRRGEISDGGPIIVSFGDWTPIDAPHVFVNPGRRYDMRVCAGLHAIVVVTQGIDAELVIRDIYDQATPANVPHLVDFERKVLALIASTKPLTLWPEPKGSGEWKRLFE